MNTTREIIDDLKEGKMVIIVDDEDREQSHIHISEPTRHFIIAYSVL